MICKMNCKNSTASSQDQTTAPRLISAKDDERSAELNSGQLLLRLGLLIDHHISDASTNQSCYSSCGGFHYNMLKMM